MIKWLVIAIISLIVLGALGYNIRDTVNQPSVRDNLQYGKEVTLNVWNNFLKGPTEFLWGIIAKYIVDPILQILQQKVQKLGEKKVSARSTGAFFLSQQGIPYVYSA